MALRAPARGADQIWLAREYIDLASISRYDLTTTIENDSAGQWVCAAIYGVGATAFLTLVLLGALDFKFVIAVVFLGAIALMATSDAVSVKPVTLFRLDLEIDDGRVLPYVSADLHAVRALIGRIDAAARPVHR